LRIERNTPGRCPRPHAIDHLGRRIDRRNPKIAFRKCYGGAAASRSDVEDMVIRSELEAGQWRAPQTPL